MSLLRLNRNPSSRQLIVFGLAWLGLLALAGGRYWWRSRHPAAEITWTLAVVIPLAGLICPRLLRHLYVGLSHATYPIGYVVSHVVLALAYYLVLTPVGLTMRLFRYDPLTRRFEPMAPSYWKPRETMKTAES